MNDQSMNQYELTRIRHSSQVLKLNVAKLLKFVMKEVILAQQYIDNKASNCLLSFGISVFYT